MGRKEPYTWGHARGWNQWEAFRRKDNKYFLRQTKEQTKMNIMYLELHACEKSYDLCFSFIIPLIIFRNLVDS